jgi:predicted nucleotidyltransferase
MDTTVLGIAEARASLPSLVDRIGSGELDGVLIGSHRKAAVAIVPLGSRAANAPVSLAQLRRLSRLTSRLGLLSGIRNVAVFGSVARGDERAGSDVDLLVDVAPGTTLFDLAQFQDDMEQLLGTTVDVVTRASLDAERDRAILSQAVPL